MTQPAATSTAWHRLNQIHLAGELAALGKRLAGEGPDPTADREARESAASMSPPPALDTLAAVFGLSSFEREVLLLLAGIELDSTFASQCGALSGSPQRGSVTFSFAMGTLKDPHWSALATASPLRRFQLIHIEPGHGLTYAPLRIDERILLYLVGVNRLDERLTGILACRSKPDRMADEHLRLLAEILHGGAAPSASTTLHLCGDDLSAQESMAALIAQHAGRELYVLRHEDTPAAGAELEQFVRLWTRESLLLPGSLLLQWEGEIPSPSARRLAERLPAGLLIASRDSLQLHRVVQRYDVNKPGPSAQKRLWAESLGDAAVELNALVDEIAEQFRFGADTIESLAGAARGTDEPERASARLWNVCRSHARPRLEALTERIVPASTWDDLVLPPSQTQTLRNLVAQSRNRLMVYETWGFGERGRRGLGLSALFSGPSGTGKTLAAEVLAGELKLDLYRIDLSSVVSKYIGETEKNLKQVFDAAENGGVLLLFDEADALFGKRSEVKDSHDRYANIEVGYLLQRMESFQGLAVLTTNSKTALDKAFQRRIRFSVDFPFPDAVQREAIWKRVFPGQAPTSDLKHDRLAALNVSGGSIRTIALNAAFLAAESKEAINMGHVRDAAELETSKIERPIAARETRGWK
jgi:hypothetical protein